MLFPPPVPLLSGISAVLLDESEEEVGSTIELSSPASLM
jgi:hypothetical protein